MSQLAGPFTTAICDSLRQNMNQIARCAGLLTPQQAWSRPNERCNSVANLVLHLNGNVGQWMLGGIAGRTIDRDRPAEFAARDGGAIDEPLARLQKTVADASGVIAGLDEASLARTYVIQGYSVSGIVAVYHIGEHFSFHAGQIIHITKAILAVDLSLYDTQGQRGTQRVNAVWS